MASSPSMELVFILAFMEIHTLMSASIRSTFKRRIRNKACEVIPEDKL